ncbi:hypothetical protein MHBO_005111, partial [Bonamia ostreae]
SYNKDVFENAQVAARNGVSFDKFYDAYFAQKDVKTKDDKKKAIDNASGKLNDKEKYALYQSLNVGASDERMEKFKPLKSKGMKETDFLKYMDAIDSAKGIKNQRTGRTVSGTLKNAQYKALTDAGMSKPQARYFMTVMLGSKW